MGKAGARRSLIERALAHRSIGPYLALHSSGSCPSAGPAKGRIKPDNMIVLSFIRVFPEPTSRPSALRIPQRRP